MLAMMPLAGALALWFAWRNFVRPAAVGRRIVAQFAMCFGVLLVLIVAHAAVSMHLAHDSAMANGLLMAHRTLKWEQKLTPAERQLWIRHRVLPYAEAIRLRLTPDPGASKRQTQAVVRLPLAPADRKLLIERGEMSEDLREALRREAEP